MNRPHIIINCAMSADGKIALPSGKQLRISSDEDMKRVYKMRNDCDAVLVGIGTILSDDPKLTVKKSIIAQPNQPLRVILDAKGRLPKEAVVTDTAAETIVFTTTQHASNISVKRGRVFSCNEKQPGLLDLHSVLSQLYDIGVRTLLVEGGSTIMWSFFSQNLVDEFYVYIGSMIIGGEHTPTVAGGPGITNESQLINLKLRSAQQLGEGILLCYTR